MTNNYLGVDQYFDLYEATELDMQNMVTIELSKKAVTVCGLHGEFFT
jgi:hypothetical protein